MYFCSNMCIGADMHIHTWGCAPACTICLHMHKHARININLSANKYKQCMYPCLLSSNQQSDPVRCSEQTACEFLPRKRDLDMGEHLNR